MNNKLLLGVLLLIASAAFAATTLQDKQTGSRYNMGQVHMMMNCPMLDIQDADVAVTNTPNGVTLTFTNKSGNVAELQRRVERLATMLKQGMMSGMTKPEPKSDK